MCVRYANKLLLAVIAVAAIYRPSLLGSGLLLGACVGMLCLGWPATSHSKLKGSAHCAALAVCAAYACCWALAQYTVCNEWLLSIASRLSKKHTSQALHAVGLTLFQVCMTSEQALQLTF